MPPARVLVIEDNRDTLELVRFLLEREGYQPLLAVNGREGLEQAQAELPDLILLDLSIPEVDGWHVAALLKASPVTRAIPVIALTAHTLPGDHKKALDAGCDDYLAKPLDLPTFKAMIADHLRSGR